MSIRFNGRWHMKNHLHTFGELVIYSQDCFLWNLWFCDFYHRRCSSSPSHSSLMGIHPISHSTHPYLPLFAQKSILLYNSHITCSVYKQCKQFFSGGTFLVHNTYFLMDHWQNLCSQKVEPLVLMTKWRSTASHNFIIPHFQSSAQISSVHADQASDRTSVVSLRNLDNGGQCGSDLRLGRSPGAFPSTWTRSQVSPPFPQARSSALPSRGR